MYISMEAVGEKEMEGGAHDSGAGDGENPGPEDALGDAPAHGGDASRGADSGNGAGDDVGGADRDARARSADQRERGGGFRSEAAEWSELRNFLAHRLYDAPASGHRAAGDREVAADDHPERDHVGLYNAAGDERGRDDAHALLRVVGAVAEAEQSRGDELKPAEPIVDAARRLAMDDPAR